MSSSMKSELQQRNRARVFIAAIILLALTNGATLLWIRLHPHSIEERVTEYPFIDPARNFIPQEDFIVNIQPLREDLNKLAAEYDDVSISLYFEYLNTGANININPNDGVWPASLLKVPMAMAAMKKVERGEWELSNELVLFEQDRDKGYGDLWRQPIGTRFTIEGLIKEMFHRSDNTAYQILLRNINFNELLDVVNELGLYQLFNEEQLMSVREYSRLFRALYTSSFLAREHSQTLLTYLTEADFREFLSTGIPAEVPFAHKFGVDTDNNVFLDSGIVYVPNRPYLITVAVRHDDSKESERRAKELMKRMSEVAYIYVSSF